MWFSKNPQPEPVSYEEIVLQTLECLDVPDQLGAVTNVMAQILAEHGVTPGTMAYSSFNDLLVAGLAGRVRAIAREISAGAQ